MISVYENKEEDSKAIELIHECKHINLDELEKIFKLNDIPMRERYVFYFAGVFNAKDINSKRQWASDECKFRFYKAKTSWWEKYLTYYRPLKIKFYLELNPDLPKPKFTEIDSILNLHDLHITFIRQGYSYKEEIDETDFKLMEMWDLTNPSSNYNTISGLSSWNIDKELKKIDEKFDTYYLVQKENDNITSNFGWCPICSEAPCMCSDPF